MRIGEAAAAAGCHLETIRYYERLKLLPPANRLANGYRDYDANHLERLRFIVRGRVLGFSLEEIRTLLALSASSELSCTEADRLARQQLAAVNKRISELRRMARELRRTIDACVRQSRGTCSIRGVSQNRGPKRRKTGPSAAPAGKLTVKW